jgi:hypothetical protein
VLDLTKRLLFLMFVPSLFTSDPHNLFHYNTAIVTWE